MWRDFRYKHINGRQVQNTHVHMKTFMFKAEQKKPRQQPKQFLTKLNYFPFLLAAKSKIVMSIQYKIVIKKLILLKRTNNSKMKEIKSIIDSI